MKALPTNTLVKHPAYPKILTLYNEMLQRDGKVNASKFYRDIILPEIPGYHLQSWFFFLKRFKTGVGLLAAEVDEAAGSKTMRVEAEGVVARTMVANDVATTKGINLALNIATDRLNQIMENPALMTAKEAIDLLFKAMKAQDSRINAVGKLREDNREQEKFERVFSNAAYEGES